MSAGRGADSAFVRTRVPRAPAYAYSVAGDCGPCMAQARDFYDSQHAQHLASAQPRAYGDGAPTRAESEVPMPMQNVTHPVTTTSHAVGAQPAAPASNAASGQPPHGSADAKALQDNADLRSHVPDFVVAKFRTQNALRAPATDK